MIVIDRHTAGQPQADELSIDADVNDEISVGRAIGQALTDAHFAQRALFEGLRMPRCPACDVGVLSVPDATRPHVLCCLNCASRMVSAKDLQRRGRS